MSHLETNGTLTIKGKDYVIQTYYPEGKRAAPQYTMFYVWERHAVREGESMVFASEEGFLDWLSERV